jgi:hypothetical protein
MALFNQDFHGGFLDARIVHVRPITLSRVPHFQPSKPENEGFKPSARSLLSGDRIRSRFALTCRAAFPLVCHPRSLKGTFQNMLPTMGTPATAESR